MSQCLSAYIALVKDGISGLSTHVRWLTGTCNSSCQGSDTPSSVLHRHLHSFVCTHAHTGTHTWGGERKRASLNGKDVMLWDIKKDALKLHLRKLLCSFPQCPVNWLNSAMVLLLSLVPTKFSARWILCGSDSMLLLHSLMTLGLNFSRVWFTEGLGLSSCWHSRNLFEMASCCLPLIFPSPPSSPKEHRLAWFAGCLQLRLLRDGVTVTLLDSWLAVSLQSTFSQTSPSLVPSAPRSSPFYIPLYFCRLSTNRLSYQLLLFSSDSYPQ